jgi:hypothetical protein
MRAGIRRNPTFPPAGERSHSATYSCSECPAWYELLIFFRHSTNGENSSDAQVFAFQGSQSPHHAIS